MVHIDITETSKATPEQLWAYLADAESWQRWGPFTEAGLEREGDAERDGVGAVRRFRTGRFVSREEVVAFDAPKHLGYRLLSGLPLRDYRADVTLEPHDGGTTIRWQSSFSGKVPGTGWLFKAGLQRFIRQTAQALAGAPEG